MASAKHVDVAGLDKLVYTRHESRALGAKCIYWNYGWFADFRDTRPHCSCLSCHASGPWKWRQIAWRARQLLCMWRLNITIIIWFISVGRKIRRKPFGNTVHYPCGTKNVRRRHPTGLIRSCQERKEAESKNPGIGWNSGESIEKLRNKTPTNSWIRGRPKESEWRTRGSLRESEEETRSQAKKTGAADDYNGGETWRSGGLPCLWACDYHVHMCSCDRVRVCLISRTKRVCRVRELILHIGFIPKVTPLKLFLDTWEGLPWK